MAKAPLFDLPVVRWVLKKWGVFPVNLQGGGGSGLRKAVSLMKAGEVVGIFPEGEISETGDFGTFKTGVGYIARLGGCPVLCVGLVRTNRIIPFAKIIPRPAFRKVEVRWGELIEYSKDADPEEVARDLERRVMALIR